MLPPVPVMMQTFPESLSDMCHPFSLSFEMWQLLSYPGVRIHHGTFQLLMTVLTPKKRLVGCRCNDSFLILNNGQSAIVGAY